MVLNRAKCFNYLNDDLLHDSSDDIMIQVRNLHIGFIIEIVVKWHSELFNERFDEQSHAREHDSISNSINDQMNDSILKDTLKAFIKNKQKNVWSNVFWYVKVCIFWKCIQYTIH